MYVPIMKNRTVEVSVLQQLGNMHVFDEHVTPLIELVQERTRSNNRGTFLQELSIILDECTSMRVMIDFYKSTKLRNTTDTIRNYITTTVRQPQYCVEQLKTLGNYSERVIPVVSYLAGNVDLDRIAYEANEYRKTFSQIAFRVRVQEFEHVFSYIESLVSASDYVILDIDTASHTNPVFRKIFNQIEKSRRKIGFVSIIVNAHRPDSLANKDMEDGEPIAQIDNSLKELYHTSYMHNFNGFGDYACIAPGLPSTGGAISPVGIYYSNENNFFVAYRGRAPLLSEFPEYIAPRIIESEYWSEFSSKHHENCPGCAEIESTYNNHSGRNQALWKRITMLHYIYTMYEVNA